MLPTLQAKNQITGKQDRYRNFFVLFVQMKKIPNSKKGVTKKDIASNWFYGRQLFGFIGCPIHQSIIPEE